MLKRLGRVVVLAGPNGSGKSRYLQFIHYIHGKKGENWKLKAQGSATQLTYLRGEHSGPYEEKKEAIRRNEEALRTAEYWLEQLGGTIFSAGTEPSLVLLSYPQNIHSIINARSMSPTQLRDYAKSTKQVGFDSALIGMHAYCTQIAQAIFQADHPQAMNQKDVVQQRRDANVFNNILSAFLNGEIGFTLEETEVLPTFRNRRFEPSELSTGERLLFTWAISLHRQREHLSNAIVLIDEPESHLHHDACIRALTKLRDDVLGPDGQIWLATHSVPLLAWGGLDSVHFVKDGAIEFAGNKVTSVVESLLGGRDGRDRLSTFLSDADEIAFMEFAAQCVLPAGVADPKTGDKQQEQFIDVLHQRLSSGQQLRLLDFSAGKGRFGSALRERLSMPEGQSLRGRIEYFAYNEPRFTDSEIREACQVRIAALEQPGTVEDYYWDSMSRLQARRGQEFDLVILSNVLHEIEPENWLTVFRDIEELLAPDGALVVMEDLLPPVGELPNKRGYLILDELGLGLLFGDPRGIKLLQKREERLLAVEIPKSLLSRATRETRDAALRHLRKHAEEQVKHLRHQATTTSSHRLGREHAHYSMLYTNASLALESLR